jgi:hypothetical protein
MELRKIKSINKKLWNFLVTQIISWRWKKSGKKLFDLLMKNIIHAYLTTPHMHMENQELFNQLHTRQKMGNSDELALEEFYIWKWYFLDFWLQHWKKNSYL